MAQKIRKKNKVIKTSLVKKKVLKKTIHSKKKKTNLKKKNLKKQVRKKVLHKKKPVIKKTKKILKNVAIEKIRKKSFEQDYLKNAKKWLLLGCQLGQRFGDLIRVTPEMVKASNGIKIIELTQKKTGKMVAIPLMPKAIEIIEGDMPYPISIQNFNDYVKDICKAAKLEEPIKGAKYIKLEEPDPNQPKTPGVYPKWELIGSHVCRRSFASNFYGKIPTPILIGITQHSTEKQFMKYIGRTSYDNAHQMMEYFGKLQAKEKKEPQLQVLKNAN